MGVITDREMQSKPTSRDQWIIEPAARGTGRLLGRITKSGERSFYYRYTTPTGDRDTLPLGSYQPKGNGGLTIAQAREKTNRLRELYAAGAKDLRAHLAELEQRKLVAQAAEAAEEQRRLELEQQAAEVRQRRISVRQLAARWAETQLQPRIRADGRRTGRKDGGAYTLQQFERHVFPEIGDTPVADLRKPDILALLDRRTAAGTMRTANVLLADLKQMLDFAADREYIPANPVASIKKRQVGGPSVERERVLSEAEVTALASVMKTANLTKRAEAAVWVTLATGVRVGELLGAIWSDCLPEGERQRADAIARLMALAEVHAVKPGIVNLGAGRWHLLDSKNQRDHSIHLSEFALAQFKKLQTLREVLGSTDGNEKLSPWVFPATDNTCPVHVKSFGKQLADRQRGDNERLKNRSKSSGALQLTHGKWTAHDLRRTAGNLMARLGVSTDVINECLNHMQSDRMARVYIRDRREADQVRAFDLLGAKLNTLSKGAVTKGL